MFPSSSSIVLEFSFLTSYPIPVFRFPLPRISCVFLPESVHILMFLFLSQVDLEDRYIFESLTVHYVWPFHILSKFLSGRLIMLLDDHSFSLIH